MSIEQQARLGRFVMALQSGCGCGILFVAIFGLLTHYSGDTYPLSKQAVVAAIGFAIGITVTLIERPTDDR